MTVSAQTNTNLKKLEDGLISFSSFLATIMDLRVKKEILRDNIVAYGSIGNQSFYVQAPTLEELDEKLAKVISELYKKNAG
ncbi:MAG: hypothetical protein P8J32_07095 [bacterium]|nr:hypothetical protein [bacterium]